MFKTKVGYSKNTDSYESGVETAKMATSKGDIKLGMLFTNSGMDQKKVIEGARSVLGNKPIIGCTSSSGIVVPKEGLLTGTYSGMMGFRGDDLIVGVAGSPSGDGDARSIGKRLAREAITNSGNKRVPSFFYMVASPKEEEEYLKGIEDVIGTVPFFGGSAADDTVEGKWSIFCNDKVFTDGCAVAFFYTSDEMKNVYTGNYEETKNAGIITKIEGKRTLSEIDGEPALSKYCSWTHMNANEVMGGKLLAASVTNPLGVKDPLGDITLVRHPMQANENMTINVGNNLATNTAVIQLHTTVDGLIKSNSEVLTKLNNKMKHEPDSYFLVHCGGRKLAIGDRANEIYDEVKKAIGDKEFLMIFTFGEYGANNHSANSCGGLMLSFTAFASKE